MEISAANRVFQSLCLSRFEPGSPEYQVSVEETVGSEPHNFSTGNTNACGSSPASRRAAVHVTDCAMRNASISSPLDSRGSYFPSSLYLDALPRTFSSSITTNAEVNNQVRVPTGFYRMFHEQNVSLPLLNLLLLVTNQKEYNL
jgi:hypothetical protein